MKRSFRGRVGAATVRLEAISLYATNTFDIAGKRRWEVINSVKNSLEKGNDSKVEELINAGALLMRPLSEQVNLIDQEIFKAENEKDEEKKADIQAVVNFYRRQRTDGEVGDGDDRYIIIPLETREFFDDAGTRKNQNFGKPMNYADRRRIFLLGRTITSQEVSEPALIVVEARLDQCYNFEVDPWQQVEGFSLRVRSVKEDLILLSTTRGTEWKTEGIELPELLEALDIKEVESEQSRCEILLSAPDEFQLTINDVYKMYGTPEWSKLMDNYDRFHIISADLMSKTPFTIGFRDEYLAEGTVPDDMEAESKAMNFWTGKDQEEAWLKFGNGSRIIFGGQLTDRRLWDEEAGAISEDTGPCLVATVFVPIPEYREEPE